jgi:ureidoglycolate hydrolase
MSTIEPITPILATSDSVAPFGTLIEPGEDGTPFGPADAQLDLSRGTPRFYIMRLPHRPLLVRGITRHRLVTQCLGAADGKEWFICLAPASDVEDPAAKPDPAAITCFRVPPGRVLALHRGTWHAGPFFEGAEQDFLNLELHDTNEVDHHTVRLDTEFGVALQIMP